VRRRRGQQQGARCDGRDDRGGVGAHVPELHDGAGFQRSGGDLLPADDALAVGAHHTGGRARQRRVVVAVQGHGLVAADVQVLPRGHRREVAEHVLEEDRSGRQRGGQPAEAHLHAEVLLDRLAARHQLAVRVQRRVDVPRHVDLGHHRDAARGGVRQQGRPVVGRVVAARVAPDRRARRASHQLRAGRQVQPPRLVVGEVQVQHVELVRRDEVDDPPQVVGGHHVPGDVHGQAAPRVARRILDEHGGDRREDRPVVRQQLTQGGDGALQTGDGARDEVHHVGGGGEPVGLVARRETVRRRVRQQHDDRARSGGLVGPRHPHGHGVAAPASQQIGDADPDGEQLVAGADDDGGRGADDERPCLVHPQHQGRRHQGGRSAGLHSVHAAPSSTWATRSRPPPARYRRAASPARRAPQAAVAGRRALTPSRRGAGRPPARHAAGPTPVTAP